MHGVIRVFGTAGVDGDGALPRRDRQVLATLVVTRGGGCPAERLAAAVYGEEGPPPTWRKVVQGSVVRLRRVLGSRAIDTTADGYQLLVGDDQIDVGRFEHLVARGRELMAAGEQAQSVAAFEEALGLATGDPLCDLDGWDPARSEASRLRELRAFAEEQWIEALLASGRHREAIAGARSLAEAEPLREQRWVVLALAQYRAGRQGEALRSIGRARRVLVEELGVDPGRELVDLENAILSQDPSLAVPEAEAVSEVCPYRGLAAYELNDAETFFGREAAVAECLERVTRTGFVAVVGPSGCGKSSLARAGIAPGLARRGGRVAIITPGTHPAATVAEAPRGVALVVDQLEELFTQCADPAERAAFVAALDARAVTELIVVTLRSDHLASTATLPTLADRIEEGLYLLRPMTAEDLRACIEGPARRAGLHLESGLVELLVHDVADRPGALPLLSHVMTEIWARRQGPVLTVAAYRAAGGLHGAVSQTAERAMRTLAPDGQRIARELFLRLVALTDGAPVRHRLPLHDLAVDTPHADVLDTLFGARLVTIDHTTVQVAHEALAVAWPRLRSWLDEDQEGQRILQHLAASAAAWATLDRDPGELYRGGRLRQTQEWVDANQPTLTPSEHAFLDASLAARRAHELGLAARADEETRANRRLRRALVGIAAGLAVALVAATVAVVQRGRAETNAFEAETARLSANVERLVSEDQRVALLLAVEAHDRDPSLTSTSTLQRALTGRTAFLGFVGPGGEPAHAAYTSDGDIVLASTDEIRIYDPAGSTPKSTIPHPGPQGRPNHHALAASPSEPLVAARNDTEVEVYDVSTGVRISTITPSQPPTGVWFSPLGHIVVATQGPQLEVFDAEGNPQTPFPTPFRVHDVAFDADGTTMVTAAGIPDPAGLRVWDLTTRAELAAPEPLEFPSTLIGSSDALAHRPVAVTFSADDRYLAAGYWDGHVAVWDAATWHVHRFERSGAPAVLYDPGRLIFDVEILATEPLRVVAMGNNSISEWNLSEGLEDAILRDPSAPTATRAVESARSLAVDHRAHTLLTGHESTELWSTDDRGLLARPLAPPSWNDLSLSSDGSYLIRQSSTAGRMGDIWKLDLASGDETLVVEGATWGATLSPDDRLLVASGPIDGRPTMSWLRQWDPTTLEELAPPIEVPCCYQLREFSPDGRHLAIGYGVLLDVMAVGLSADPGLVEIYEVTESGLTMRHRITEFGQMLFAKPGGAKNLDSLIFDGEGTRLLTSGGAVTAEWSAPDGGLLRGPSEFEPDSWPLGRAHTHGAYAWKRSESLISLIDQDTLQPVGDPFIGAHGPNPAGVFSPDDSTLFTGGFDRGHGTVAAWDVSSRRQIGSLYPNRSQIGATGVGVRPVVLTADSNLGPALLTTTPNALLAWNLEPDSWPRLACLAAARNLTREEWAQFGPDEPYHATCDDWPAPEL